MWNLPCLIFLVVVVMCASEEEDPIIGLLSEAEHQFYDSGKLQCTTGPYDAQVDDATLQRYLQSNPDTGEITEIDSKRIIESKFDILYGPNLKLNKIYVSNSVQLYLKIDAVMTLVPIKNGDQIADGVTFTFTATQNYITMTLRNLTVTNEGAATSYKQIRVIIAPSGIILIIYDIDQESSNVFLTRGTHQIPLKRGLILKTHVCTLFELSKATNEMSQILEEFVDPTKSVIQLNDNDFKKYFTTNPDSTSAKCIINICTVESKFNITYGDTEVNKIYIANSTKLYFAEEASLSLVHLEDHKPVQNGIFNYSATNEYVSMTWHNLTLNENRTYDIRVIIFPYGDIIVLYKFTNVIHISTVYDILPLMERKIVNRTVLKITVNDVFEHWRPNILLGEVKRIISTTDSCVTQLNDGSGNIFKTLFAIKEDKTWLSAADKNKIRMKFVIQSNDKFLIDIMLRNMPSIDDSKYKIPIQLYNLMPFNGLTNTDEDTLRIRYTTTSDYTSLTLANVTSSTADSKITFDVRAVIYPTGDIIFGFKTIAGVTPQKIVILDTPMKLTNGMVILSHARPCKN